MSKENVLSMLECPVFELAGIDHTIEKGRFVSHNLYVTRKKIKIGTAIELIDRYDKSLERRQLLQLEFYSPHGITMEAPIFRLGKVYSGEIFDEIEVLVVLTQEQLWALNPDFTDTFSY